MAVALVERKFLGGTCVNFGCMPTKTLVASARAAHMARRGADFGVMVEGPVRIDMARVKARADAVIANARGNLTGWLGGMERRTLVEGHPRFAAPDTNRGGVGRLHAPRASLKRGGRAGTHHIPAR